MASDAKAVFDRNIERASHFLDIHQNAQRGPGAPTLPLRELPRAAIVFGVGALDAYLTELAGEILVARLGAGTGNASMRNVLQRASGELPTLAIETALLPEGADRLAYVRSAIVEHFQTAVSAHGSKAVARTLQMVDANTANVWSSVSSNGSSDPAKKLDDWTDIRHRIVHRGERPRTHRVRARECLDLIAAIVDAIEDEVARSSAVITAEAG